MFRYQPLLFQPVQSLLGYSLTELAEQVRAVHFPELEHHQVEARFAAAGPLAYVAWNFMGQGKHLIALHPVLNHRQTPSEVLRFVFKHELTHLVIRPVVLDGWYERHPPAFWKHEAAIAPERYAIWSWIHRNLNACARNTPLGYRVSRKWHAFSDAPRGPYTPTLPFSGERWERLCPGDGSQLRLPPDWPVPPAP